MYKYEPLSLPAKTTAYSLIGTIMLGSVSVAVIHDPHVHLRIPGATPAAVEQVTTTSTASGHLIAASVNDWFIR